MNVLFDFRIFIIQTLPVLLRKPKQVAWVACMVSPFVTMLQELQNFIDTTLLDAKYSAQTQVFTYLLKSKFPAFQLFIENSNKTIVSDTYIGTGLLNDYDVFIGTGLNNNYNVIIGTGIGGTTVDKPDFYVVITTGVPTAIQIMAIRSYVNKYKIYSTTYQIVNFAKTVIYYKNYN